MKSLNHILGSLISLRNEVKPENKFISICTFLLQKVEILLVLWIYSFSYSSIIVEITSRNFNSLKVLNYRQIEKRILDRILSPKIYDNQIRSVSHL